MGGALQAYSVSVNPADGSCWTAYNWNGTGEVVHYSSTGSELWQSLNGVFALPQSVSVNPTDGSCWVGDLGRPQSQAMGQTAINPAVVHLASDGTELWRSAGLFFYSPVCVSVNQTDGSCWVADSLYNRVVHLVLTTGSAAPVASFTAAPTSGPRCLW